MLPLEGLRIIAFSQYGAGPYGTLHLADLGAEVIKIEDPVTKGDISRYIVPYAVDQDSLFFQTFNRNKRSMTLNLRVPEAREILHNLVSVSDVVFCTMRGDKPEKMGLVYSALKDVNPKIVCVSLSGFGNTGPRAKEPGYDYLIQGLAGWMSLTGEPEGPPAKSGLSMVDYATGLVAALSIMIGVYSANRNGIGCDVDLSLFDTAVSLLSYLAVWHLNKGFQPKRMADSAHPTVVPSQSFQTKNGHIVVMCQKDVFYNNLCQAMDRPDLQEDPRFGSLKNRYENKAILIPLLEEVFLEKTTDEWIRLLKKHNVPCGPINRFEEVFSEPQVKAREMVIEVDHPLFGKIKEMASPIKIGGVLQKREAGAPHGADTDGILRDYLHYAERDIVRFRKIGAI